jgi:hypothetical protein
MKIDLSFVANKPLFIRGVIFTTITLDTTLPVEDILQCIVLVSSSYRSSGGREQR